MNPTIITPPIGGNPPTAGGNNDPTAPLRAKLKAQIAARSCNLQQFQDTMSFFAAYFERFRIVVRNVTADDYSGGNYGTIMWGPGATSQEGSDNLAGLYKYLCGRPLAGFADFDGLQDADNGVAEIEMLIKVANVPPFTDLWMNARTGQVTQYPGGMIIPLTPQSLP